MIKYNIKHRIVNCEKTDSMTSHDLPPPPPVTNCHTFSNPSHWSVTYYMDDPKVGGPNRAKPESRAKPEKKRVEGSYIT